MPMSWKQGSQLTMTSVSTSYFAPMNIASALEWMLRWVMTTALGEPVEPDVSCISATSSSEVSIGSIGSAASSASTVSTFTPRSSSTGTATRKGSETMTALASIMSMTLVVSLAHCSRSVRGVGWCSIVRLAPRIHSPWAVGAISTGAPASTPTASPRPMPAAARPPAMRRARSCTSRQVWRTGSWGSPVTMPLELVMALWNILSVKRLTMTSSASGAGSSAPLGTAQTPGISCSTCPYAVHRRHAGTSGALFGLESVMLRRRRVLARPGTGWAIRTRGVPGR